jgi:hypothetical protein
VIHCFKIRFLFVPFFVGMVGQSVADDLPKFNAVTGNSGFSQPLPGASGVGVGFDEAGELLSGLSAGCSASSFYDSNLNQSSGSGGAPVEDDFVQSLSTTLQWARSNSLWSVGLGASGSYELPLNTPDYKSVDYGVNADFAYHAGRLELALQLNQSFNEGSNRFYAAGDGGAVRQSSYGFGFSAAYKVSSKTSLVSTYNSSWTDGQGELMATVGSTANISAMWRYSPLLQVGPGLGYTGDSGSSLDARTTLGPTLSANYQVSRKISVQGLIGWEFTSGGSRSDGGSEPSLSTSLSASYALDRLWGFSLSLNRGVEADALADVGFRESTALQFAVDHRIGRANAVLALGYDQTAYLQAPEDSGRSGVDYLTSSFSVSMPVIGDRASATAFVRYNNSMSDDLLQDWDGFQIGCSLGYQF